MLAQGTLRPGSRLGTEREMAERFAVSRSTLRSALLPLGRGRRAGAAHRPQRVAPSCGRTWCSGTPRSWPDCPRGCAAAGIPAPPGSWRPIAGPPPRPKRPHSRSTAVPRFRDPAAPVRRRVPLSVDHACFPVEQVPDLLEQPLGGSSTSCSRSATGWCQCRRPRPSRWSAPAPARRTGWHPQPQAAAGHHPHHPRRRRPALRVRLRPVPGRPGAADGDDLVGGRPRTAGYRRPGGAFREQRLIGRLAWDR